MFCNHPQQPNGPLNYARMAQRLLEKGNTEQKVAEVFQVSVRTLRKYLSLLTLPSEVQVLVEDGLPATKGYELARNPDALKAFLQKSAKTPTDDRGPRYDIRVHQEHDSLFLLLNARERLH